MAVKGCERNYRGSVSDRSHCHWVREKHDLDLAASSDEDVQAIRHSYPIWGNQSHGR